MLALDRSATHNGGDVGGPSCVVSKAGVQCRLSLRFTNALYDARVTSWSDFLRKYTPGAPEPENVIKIWCPSFVETDRRGSTFPSDISLSCSFCPS